MLLEMQELPNLEKRSQRFKFARTKLTDFTQQDVAEKFGVTPQAVSGWERGEDAPTTENLIKMSELYRVPIEWLTKRPGTYVVMPTAIQAKRVPMISRIKAGLWSPQWTPYEDGHADTFLYTDVQVSNQAFALEIDGTSMEPEFQSGDAVIIDPRIVPRPGDYVAAKLDGEDESTFKKYRPKGGGVIELVPLNPDWPVLLIDSDHQGKIIGTMIEHRRFRRR